MARVLVMGTGAVGGYYGGAMAAAGHEVVFVARGENLAALRSGGLRVTGARASFSLDEVSATDEPSTAGERDLVVMCVKSYDLSDAAAACKPNGGVVLTLQNGVDAAERVNAAVGAEVALAGTTGIVADLTEPGHVDVVSSYAWIRFGEPSGVWSSRTELVGSWLSQGGRIDAQPLEDVRPALWEKMAVICGLAGLTTLYLRPIGAILADPHGRATYRRIVSEVFEVGRASGVPLGEDFIESRMHYVDGIDPAATASMSRDFRRGRRLEVDTIHGAIVRMGSSLGVPVPVHEAVYAGIRLSPRPGTSGRPGDASMGV